MDRESNPSVPNLSDEQREQARKAGADAAWSTHTDVLQGISPEADSENEAADFSEYVGECVPRDLSDSQRREWMRIFCDTAAPLARDCWRERQAEQE